MNRSESRYFRSAEKMGAALMSLMEKKDFEYVTVQEICKAAGVHRSTFYLHYENTSDLLEDCIHRLLEEFRLQFAPGDILQSDCFITEAYLLPFLAYVRSHQRVWQTVLRQRERFGAEQLYNQLLQRLFDPILARYGYPKHTRDYVIRFYLCGVTAVTVRWLERNCAESDEEMCRVIRNCILGKAEE